MNTNYIIKHDEQIEGLQMITPFYMEDERGYFLKHYEANIFEDFGIEGNITEAFESLSVYGVIRGLHFQLQSPQIKLIRVISGEILDVAVDLRKNSGTFGKYKTVMLNDRNHMIFYIPAGFAHGYQVLSEKAVVLYQCIGSYDKNTDTGIYYKDAVLGIPWKQLGLNPIVSVRDESLMPFDDFVKNYKGLVN